MAEAVRPTKKKKKVKKQQGNVREGLRPQQKEVFGQEKAACASVEEDATVSELTCDDYKPGQGSGKFFPSQEDHVYVGDESVTCQDVDTKTLNYDGRVLSESDRIRPDVGHASAQSVEGLVTETVDTQERDSGNAKQSETLIPTNNASSDKKQFRMEKAAVVIGTSVELNSGDETCLVQDTDLQGDEGIMRTGELLGDTGYIENTSHVGQGTCKADTELVESHVGVSNTNYAAFGMVECPKTDLAGEGVEDRVNLKGSHETSGQAFNSFGITTADENVSAERSNEANGSAQELGNKMLEPNPGNSLVNDVGVELREGKTDSVVDHGVEIQNANIRLSEDTSCADPVGSNLSTVPAAVSRAAFVEKRDSTVGCSSDMQSHSSQGKLDISQDKNSYSDIHTLFGKQQAAIRTREPRVAAFTEDDLKSFYYNPALIYIEDYVEDFIKETLVPQRQSEFYELLKTYQNSSMNLRNVESEIKILQEKCDQQKKTVWTTQMQTVTVQGVCKDQQKVSYTHSYEVVSFNAEQATKVGRTLDSIKNTIHETFTLAKYSCQLARIHVTSYLYELHFQSPVFCGISEESPVIGNDPSHVSHVVFGEIQHLRDCISTLFTFIRRPTDDEAFYDDVNAWLQNLVGLLLRVATFPDHIFLLNHVLRCPPGVTRKLAHFIQPLLFASCSADFSGCDYFWHDPVLHHFVTMLATLLLPIRLREKYLLKMKALLAPDGSETQKTTSWVIVDEDGEEDENPEESWMLIPENDLVALFLQFAFDALFKIIVGTEESDGISIVESSFSRTTCTTATNVMQVFAFSTCLIQMLGKAFSLYSKRRYREFVKRLGRAIRTIVMHVSRYWSVYKDHYVNKYGDNETTFHLAFGSEYSLEKLQLEYDQFFIRAAQQIFSAHKLGAWQFLIDMPFKSLSSSMMWTCYCFLHKGIADRETFASLTDYISSTSDHLDANDTPTLVECFKTLTEAEVVFLLTTFANMARARTKEDNDFIFAISREIYEVSYINRGTEDFLCKTGKDLLSSICCSHSFVISFVLERVVETLECVREECVGLFQAFPVEIWRPKLRDIQTVRNWLLRSAVDSPEHQLSRYLLTNINWQYQDLESDVLYLPRSVHRAAAVLLVETCALRLPNRPGGIAADGFKDTPGILEQVTQMATAPYQRIIQHYSDQELYKWLWEVISYLHLHHAECPDDVMDFTNRPSTSRDEGFASSYDRSDFFKTLSRPEPLDLDTDEVLINVLTSASKDGPLACYAALQMSSYGHAPEYLGGNGLTYLSVILDEGHIFPTCRIIENATPTFFARDLLGFSENSRFTRIIDAVIHSDAQWRDQSVLEVMSAIIQKHVQNSGVLPGTNRALLAIEFWLRTLCFLPNWNKDSKVLQLLNNLLKCAFKNSDAHETVVQYFLKRHEDTLKSLKEQGFLSSLLSFVLSNPSHANLVDIKTSSSNVYYCYYILCAESLYQEQCGLKLALANKLHDKKDMCIETALKKVFSSMKEVVPIPSCNLDTYRWADLALSLDHEHPVLAIVWQKFFQQFLRRVPSGQGVPERGSVGLRFFESTANTTYLKRLKARLMGTAEHHKSLSTSGSETRDDDALYKTPVELNKRLAKLFQTLALWLDEPRIHDPTLYLQGLPPVYDPARLATVLKSDETLWLDCVDFGRMDWEFSTSTQCWVKFNKERQKKICTIQNRQLMRKIDRICNRKKSLDDVVSPPSFEVVSTPLPELPVSVLLDKQRIMETLGNNLRILAEHARKFSMKFSANSALDLEYMEMLEELFRNAQTEIRVSIPCKKRSPVCKGAADIVLKFREKKVVDLVRQRAVQNREEYGGLIQEMLMEMPMDICLNALCVEKSLTLLLKQWNNCQNPSLVKKFEKIGSSIFYMFIDMISDGVRRFPPTMQFFSTCVELLGKAFIMGNKEQTAVLLRTILVHPNIVGLLLPIFQPSTCENTFIEMYENIIQTSLDVEVKFSLLSKFDFRSWLSSKPTISERITMMKVLFAALCDCGFEPPVRTTMLSEIYLKKITTVLLHNFPDLFGETLRLLVDGSADHALCMNAWNEFLITTKILVKNMERRELELNTSPPFLLGKEQVNETMTWLMDYSRDQRMSCRSGSSEGMFTMWSLYQTPLIALYEYLSRQSISAREQELTRNDDQDILVLWKRINDFFSPWIFPCEISGMVMNYIPWSEQEVVPASKFVDLYTRLLMYFQTFLPAPSAGKPNVLSLLWELYSSWAMKNVLPAFVLRVYHAKFTCLSWNVFHPTVSYLESMLQICVHDGSCRSFLGCIFPRIPWSDVLQRLRAQGNVNLLYQFQVLLLNLLLVLGNEKALAMSEGSEMITLLKAAEKFDWDLLDSDSYHTVCDWLVSNCNFTEVLEPSSTIWFSLRLLQAASLLSDPVPATHAYIDIPQKRLHYLNCVVRLLCKCSASAQHSPGLYRPVVEQLMDRVLAPVNSGETINSDNITAQYMEILNLFNKLYPREKLLGLVLETCQEKLRDLTGRTMILSMITASCHSLASISLMVQLVEVSVETHFNNIQPVPDARSGPADTVVSPWTDVLGTLTVPELSQREFVQECINHNAVLTLFAHLVQCLSQCQSPAHELNILKDLTSWSASIKPCNRDTETKVILLWYKIMQLFVRQINYDVNLRDLGQQIDFLIPLVTQAGEDRDTSGLLGVIGLGKKSPLSVSFRFLCRALSTFLACQLPSNGIPRVKPNSPGAVKDSAKKESSGGGAVHATPRATSAFHNLETLRVNKTYSSLLRHVEFSCEFIIDPSHSICDGPEFLKRLTTDLFKDRSYLDVTV